MIHHVSGSKRYGVSQPAQLQPDVAGKANPLKIDMGSLRVKPCCKIVVVGMPCYGSTEAHLIGENLCRIRHFAGWSYLQPAVKRT